MNSATGMNNADTLLTSLRRFRLNQANPYLILLVGFCLGHWQGKFFSAGGEDLSSIGVLQKKNRGLSPNGTTCVIQDGDGWHAIHVFYGKDDQLLNPQQRWYAQSRQDELVIALLRNKTNGYFVDLAANHAVDISNTFALETFYNWTGVCIEPNPMYWDKHAYRKCMTIGAIVGAVRMQEVNFRFLNGVFGGIAEEGFDNGEASDGSTEKKYTVPLLEILQEKARAPTVIDYLSLDVEGAETLVMKNFPLDQYRIKIITAERLKDDIKVYLEAHGYEFVQQLTSFGEDLWIHSSFRSELDLSVMERFGFPVY